MPKVDEDVYVIEKCKHCGGPAFACEIDGVTGSCRLYARAIQYGGVDPDDLAKLLRRTEDGAWERLSEARTKRIAEAETILHDVGDFFARVADSRDPVEAAGIYDVDSGRLRERVAAFNLRSRASR